jgi:Txe/YoeB family toxin of Txe-Axe toxin-antitoxin module
MIGHGLGPGFTIVATRMSVIFRVEGLEFVFTVLGYAFLGCSSSNPLASASAEVFIMSRRLNRSRRLIYSVLSSTKSTSRQNVSNYEAANYTSSINVGEKHAFSANIATGITAELDSKLIYRDRN